MRPTDENFAKAAAIIGCTPAELIESYDNRHAGRHAQMVIALNEARADLYDAWHSHMSKEKFEANPTIRAIDAALKQVGAC